MTEQLTSAIIKSLMRFQFVEQQHLRDHVVMFDEFIPGTGYSQGSNSRIDAWTIDLWPTNQMIRKAFEIKVSRSDFIAELKHPPKRRFALLYSNEFYFVAPKGIIRPAELPTEAGLIEVTDQRDLQTIVKAPFRDSVPPTWALVAAIARRTARLQGARGCLVCGERLKPTPTNEPWFSFEDGGIHHVCAQRVGEISMAIQTAPKITFESQAQPEKLI